MVKMTKYEVKRGNGECKLVNADVRTYEHGYEEEEGGPLQNDKYA
jgi:hypothetical protein